jgi:hypothetical protein
MRKDSLISSGSVSIGYLRERGVYPNFGFSDRL